MSRMLEQAIIDAKALKEAALKSAETEIVEKYAPEVKKMMESILEAEDDLDNAIDVTVDGAAATEDPLATDLPLAAAAGENACACPDEEEMISIDLDGLAAIAQSEEEPLPSEQEPIEPLADLVPPEGEEEGDLTLEEDDLASVIAELLGEEETVEEVSLEEGRDDEKEEDCEKDPSDPRCKGPNAGYGFEESKKNESIDLKKIAGKKKELLETIKALQVQNDNFKADNKKLLSGMSEQKKNIQKLATTLENLSLQNAKLLYTNEVLKSDSLNERQRQIAVEALHETKSVEHAKTVFETLQSTVVSTKRQGRPESLSEVVSNNTSKRMPRRKETKIINPHEQRWKLLAGIK